MYLLKQLPEDFLVTEIPKMKLAPSGRYIYVKITKKNQNTQDVAKQLAKVLHIREKDIGFAGNKDKNAVTAQVFSIKGVSKEKIAALHTDFTIEILGRGNSPVSLGDLEGNQFTIIIRNLEEEKIVPVMYIPNYFDEQRFARNNAEIGKQLITKNFANALELMNYTTCARHLEQHRNDYIGALKLLPLRLLKMYLNAYQSFLWNETLAAYLKTRAVIHTDEYSLGDFIFVRNPERSKELVIPLIGFDVYDSSHPEINIIIETIFKQENIKPDNFIIRQIPALTQAGEERSAFVEVKDLRIGPLQKDELNLGRKKVKVSFFLPKGSYATIAIRAMIKRKW